MDSPRYLQVLAAHRWIATLGVVAAIVAGFFSAYTIADGSVAARGDTTYTATSRLLLSSPVQPPFSAVTVVPEVEPAEGSSAPAQQPEIVDLSVQAVVYAYLIESDTVLSRVEETSGLTVQGGLTGSGDRVTAVARTTPPAGNETIPGRLALPVVDIVASSTDADRAEEIARVTAEVFNEYVMTEQDESNTPVENRIAVDTIVSGDVSVGESSNPAIPALLGFVLVMLVTALLIALVHGVQVRLQSRRAKQSTGTRRRSTQDDGAAPPTGTPPATDAVEAEDAHQSTPSRAG